MHTLNRLISFLAAMATLGFAQAAFAGAYEDTIVAARDDRTDIVVDFVQRGMDVNTADPSGKTLLMFAAENGNEKLLEFLLKNGANVLIRNKYGDTAVAIAALRGHLQVVRDLVEAGAAIDADGWTPLQYAAFDGHADIVSYLINQHALVDARAPNGQTALMFAARNGHVDVVKLLVSAHADVNLDDGSGNTALALALKAGNTDIADYLRGAGATNKQ
jgi:ankyrin repeat protein